MTLLVKTFIYRLCRGMLMRRPLAQKPAFAYLKKLQGFTFIEILVFIVVIGIVATGTFIAFNTVLANSNQPGQVLKAVQLANARMNIILQQRLVNGFSNISDPCVLGSPPAACTILTTFASTQGLAVSSAIVASGSDVKTATVTVTGTGNAQVVMRFVQ